MRVTPITLQLPLRLRLGSEVLAVEVRLRLGEASRRENKHSQHAEQGQKGQSPQGVSFLVAFPFAGEYLHHPLPGAASMLDIAQAARQGIPAASFMWRYACPQM
jgi:hypothetical protein